MSASAPNFQAALLAHLWLRDLTRDVESRLTAPPQSPGFPVSVWSPDGARMAFSIDRDLYLKDASGSPEEPLVQNANQKTPSD